MTGTHCLAADVAAYFRRFPVELRDLVRLILRSSCDDRYLGGPGVSSGDSSEECDEDVEEVKDGGPAITPAEVEGGYKP